MTMTGIYRIALLPPADEQAFAKHMTDVVFQDPDALQLTRITEGMKHQLLRIQSEFQQYAWLAEVHLLEAVPYDFAQSSKRVQESIKTFGVLVGIDVYTNIGAEQTTGL